MFTEKTMDSMVYLVSDRIGVKHGFTTRYGGVSTGIYSSLNVGENRGDDPACVRVADNGDRRKVFDPVPYDADGLVTNVPGLPMMIYIADCIPVLLCDDRHGVIGAVHCGWRSSVADILKNAVEEMCRLGAKPECIGAAIGPGIGWDHFEVGPEVVDAARRYLGGDISDLVRKNENGKDMLDLKRVNARRLIQLGLREDHIDISQECTMCKPEKYWSHRVTGGQRGSQCAVIML